MTCSKPPMGLQEAILDAFGPAGPCLDTDQEALTESQQAARRSAAAYVARLANVRRNEGPGARPQRGEDTYYGYFAPCPRWTAPPGCLPGRRCVPVVSQ